jgi:hypothetical protein
MTFRPFETSCIYSVVCVFKAIEIFLVLTGDVLLIKVSHWVSLSRRFGRTTVPMTDGHIPENGTTVLLLWKLKKKSHIYLNY